MKIRDKIQDMTKFEGQKLQVLIADWLYPPT